MTPQERRLVEDLFERLATLEQNPREPDAEAAIRSGLRLAPNATYALVQTVLLQDEALRQANERIQELEYAEPPQQQGGGGFLDSMRDAMFGGGNSRGSVPETGGGRPMGVPASFPRANEQYQQGAGAPYQQQGAGAPYQQGAGSPYQQQVEPQRGGGFGGSFLGTAAAAAAGVIGGNMLMNSMKGMFGGDQAKAQGLGNVGSQDTAAAANPWGDAGSGGGDLARQAGLDNIGQQGGGQQHAGLFDQPQDPADDGYEDGFDADFDSDFS